ncbi:TonB-dependent receptor domain-containing protein [Hydrogenophaga sp. UC242_50]|uniref:TonB-dependent receptor domain-containing protein n=1 Tax=Hydrogenophaga sp. UC242_50 TaxID=3350169 RepID=UPI0036D31BC7
MSRASTPSAGQRGVSSGYRFPLQATAVACSLYALSLGAAHAQQAEGSLSEVVVSASGVEQKIADAPASISVVTREELAKRPYTTLLDAVRDIEGVDVGETTDKTGQGTISIRGMGADYTLILIDGKRQNNNGDLYPNSFGGNQFNHIPPIETIERIEVIRGPMSTLYGADALGGVINIITRKIPDQWTGSVTQSFTVQGNSDFGDDKTTDFNLMGPIKPGVLGFQLRGSLYDRDASRPEYADVVYPNGAVRPRALGFGGGGKTVDNKNQSLGMRLALTPSARHEFLFDVDTSRQTYNNRPEADGSFPLGTVDSIATIWRSNNATFAAPQVGYLPEQKFTRDQWSLTHKGKWDIGNSEISLSYVDTANKGRTLPFSPEERARLQALWAAVPGANATAKLNNMTPAQRATLESFLPRPARVMETRQYTLDGKLDIPLGNHLVVVGGQYIDGEMEDGTFGMFGNNPQPGTVQKHEMTSVFAEGNWQLRPGFTLTTGLRHDNHNIFGGQTSPRVYGVWEANPSWTFKGGVSTGYKTPKTSQLFPGITGFGAQGTSPFVGNPDLKPETSVNGELAAYFNSTNGHSFNATVFQNRFKDKIDSGGPTIANCEGAAPGVPCADVGLGWRDLGFASFSQTQNISRAELKGLELAGRYRLSPTWMVRANYTYTDSEQKTGAAIGRPLSESAKHMANAALSWSATPSLELFLNLEAVSDRYRGWDAPTNSAMYYKAYNMLHLGGSYRISKNVTLNARINNLLDHDFTSYSTSFTSCTSGNTCVGGQQPVFRDDYNVKAKARNFWISLNARF